jgi:hypothetical protein
LERYSDEEKTHDLLSEAEAAVVEGVRSLSPDGHLCSPSGVLASHRMLHFLVNPFLYHREFPMGQLYDRMGHDLVPRNLTPATARLPPLRPPVRRQASALGRKRGCELPTINSATTRPRSDIFTACGFRAL